MDGSVRTIEIVEPRSEWSQEFDDLAARLREALAEQALRVDHIGSTSVPGLAAKDIVDAQVTVASLEPAGPLIAAMTAAGLERRGGDIVEDHVPPGAPEDAVQWRKLLFVAAEGQRPANVHVRVQGAANQRYPLLFRDYLRAHPEAAEAYARVKRALARLHRHDVEAYYDVKDPVMDIIMAGAEEWAAATGWEP
jgi:GrpB-like predicted nucleotidyltransferase (UPF0157 family)